MLFSALPHARGLYDPQHALLMGDSDLPEPVRPNQLPLAVG